jgi:hypothetical protein
MYKTAKNPNFKLKFIMITMLSPGQNADGITPLPDRLVMKPVNRLAFPDYPGIGNRQRCCISRIGFVVDG